jgi:hypothetical protein
MAKIDTLRTAVDTISTHIDTIENATNIHFVLLLVIAGLLAVTIGYLAIKEIYGRHNTLLTPRLNWSTSFHNISDAEQKSKVGQLLQFLLTVKEELEKLQDYKDKADNFNKLEKDFEEYKEKYNNLDTQYKNLETKFNEQETKIAGFAQKLQEKDDEVKNKLAEIEDQNKANNEVLEKVKKTDALKDYATKAFDYLAFAENILWEADKKCRETGNAVRYALLQQALSNTTEIAKWKQICADINEYGIAVQNKDLKNCFQSDKQEEQLDAFRRLCLSKLKPITSALLILCEANSNLSKFGVNNLSDIASIYIKQVEEIKNKAKEVGIKEITVVTLFTKLDDNQGAESVNEHVSFPYSTVNLNKDDVAQILQFGMKTEFEEMTKTRVIIK